MEKEINRRTAKMIDEMYEEIERGEDQQVIAHLDENYNITRYEQIMGVIA